VRARREPIVGQLLVAEVALALVSCSLIFLTTRIFAGEGFVLPLLAMAGWAHLVAAIVRRRGGHAAVSVALTVVGFAVLATWFWFPTTAVLGALPGPDTFDAARAALDQGFTTIKSEQAPVATNDGLLLLAGAALVVCVAAADWMAFRLWAPFEALVPSLAAFILVVVFSNQIWDMAPVIAYAAAGVTFLLADQLARVGRTPGLRRASGARGMGRMAAVGALVAVVAIVAGIVVGPRLPGALSPILDLAGPPDENRVVISPLVQISERLVQQSDVVAFTVVSPAPANWRLTALDTFDGSIWRSGGRYEAAAGNLPRDSTEAVSADQLEQLFTIEALDTVWLPAAFQPAAIDAGEARVDYQRASSTLIIDEDDEPTGDEQLAYRVLSEVPKPTAAQLERPAGEIPGDLEPMLQLPDSFSPEVADLATAVVDRAGATTPYQQALALQDYFRDRGVFADDGKTFEYVLGTSTAGHSASAMEDFLRSGSGYCEQFAGTYAAMARSVGLPARVAVGFSWGDQDPDDPTLYRVRGRHAHAWPEVWLGEDVGWIAFEPTPGRGAPGMEDYAGVEAAQAAPTASATDDPTDGAANEPAPTTPEAPVGSLDEPLPSDALDLADPLQLDGDQPTPTWPGQLLWTALVLVVAALAYGTIVPALRLARRRAERAAAAADLEARVRLAWSRSEDGLATTGTVRSPQETHDEFARRAAGEVPDQAGAIAVLARAVEAASYAPGSVTEATAHQAEGAADELTRSTRRRASLARRFRSLLDPRPLWRRSVTRRG
jgi:transglutaminase-like putative cysteine protease